VIQVLPDADAEDVWRDHDLLAEEVLPDGTTYRTRAGNGTDQNTMIQQLRADTRVVAVEPNGKVKSPTFSQSAMAFNEGEMTPGEFYDQSLATRLELSLAHTGSRGVGVKVAILDTGVNREHPALAGRILAASHDFIDGDANPADLPAGLDSDGDGVTDEAVGHGTAVAGLVALVAPSADLLVLRVLDADGQGKAYAVASALEYAAGQGVRVANLSLQLTEPSLVLDRAIAYARARGVILVTAAGNVPGVVTPQYPASDPRVWAIGSVSRLNQASSFSSRFAGVVLSAPGEDLLSPGWDGGYYVWTGTSMAAPLVAGSVALILAQNGLMAEAQVLARLQQTASTVIGTTFGTGAGIVNPGAAVGTIETGPDTVRELLR